MAGRKANGEGSVYQRGDGIWAGSVFVELTDGRRKRIVVYGKTRREAHDKLADKLDQARRGVRAPAEEWTLAEYLDYWLPNKAVPRIKPRTAEYYESIIRLYLKPGLGHLRLSALRPSDFQRFIYQQEHAGTSPRRLQQCKQVLHRALNVAMREERVTINAAHGAELPAYHRKPIHVWTAAQLHHFINATTGHRWHAGFLLSAIYGLRPGEVAGLQWGDIDFDHDIIHVRRQLQRIVGQGLRLSTLKTDAGLRDLPLTSEVRTALLALGPTTASDAFVITSSTGTRLDPKSYYKAFLKAAHEAGLPRITLYHLRHGAATMLKDVGTDPKDAQELLGHAHISTTQQFYQHGNNEAKRASLETISKTALFGVATVTATVPNLSTGESAIYRAFTPGGPAGDRTPDTLLKSLLIIDSSTLATPVSEHLLTRTNTYILGWVATDYCYSNSLSARAWDRLDDALQIRRIALAARVQRLRMASFPLNLLPPSNADNSRYKGIAP